MASIAITLTVVNAGQIRERAMIATGQATWIVDADGEFEFQKLGRK